MGLINYLFSILNSSRSNDPNNNDASYVSIYQDGVGHDMFYAFCRPSKNPRRLLVEKSQKMDKRSEKDKIKINILSK